MMPQAEKIEVKRAFAVIQRIIEIIYVDIPHRLVICNTVYHIFYVLATRCANFILQKNNIMILPRFFTKCAKVSKRLVLQRFVCYNEISLWTYGKSPNKTLHRAGKCENT